MNEFGECWNDDGVFWMERWGCFIVVLELLVEHRCKDDAF